VTTIGGGAFVGCTSLEHFDGKYATADHKRLVVDGDVVAKAFSVSD
jgi:hypothetical protein